ncbi:hypothetical protein PC116_g1736 [Phytophthora cactorum]|nr:hypothetical protein Pcac1_g16136 [Phytophthora cactorum]KAG2868586.1 hypothetical protein PC113_g1008 [Phytophthora cactorum]KAG2935271.1 hypothetical protein PC114_g648 [Phytophthora cactorum]KAG2942935.1 hypothetical protein PC115_g1177 [Phytophthora cactorum]KAG3192330.1 hypothetical protein C6341_g751 [Phytophthora cactorum]
MGALLKHENRLSVLNFSVQRPSSSAGKTRKSKEELSFTAASDDSRVRDHTANHTFNRVIQVVMHCILRSGGK